MTRQVRRGREEASGWRGGRLYPHGGSTVTAHVRHNTPKLYTQKAEMQDEKETIALIKVSHIRVQVAT